MPARLGAILRTTYFSSLLLLGASSASAQGVQFTTTSLPRQMRLEGVTETAGEVVIQANSSGTILAGSSIDIVYSQAITNNSTASTNNITLFNNVRCDGTQCPPTMTASLVGGNTVRIFFTGDTAVSNGTQIAVFAVRVNANGAAGVGSVTATLAGFSPSPATNPISFSNPQVQVGVLNSTISANFNHSSATPNPVTSFFTCAFPNDTVDDFFIRVNELFPAALTTWIQEQASSNALFPTNGVNITVTITNVPAGLSLSATGTQLSTGALSMSAPFPAPTIDQTMDGEPIFFTYAVTASDTSQIERTTLNFSLKPTTSSTANPLAIANVVAPISIQGIVQISPITILNSVIVRFVNNQIGPTTLATISNCPPPRPIGPQLISE